MKLRQAFIGGIAALALSATAFAADGGQGKDDEWSVTMDMHMTKPMDMGMPSMTHKVCTPAGAFDQGPPQTGNADCKVDHFEKSGSKITYAVSCDMQGTHMTGEGWTDRPDPTHYKGEMKVAGDSNGMPMAMTMSYTGVRVGGCTAKSE